MGEPQTQHDAEALEAGYSWKHRLYEYGGMLVAISMSGWLCSRIAQSPPLSGWWVPLEALAGILIADWTSGLFHWGFDSWGSVDTPVVGKLAIRTFRHHHVDPKAITRHDFVETNGHNIALTTIYSVIGLFVVDPPNATLNSTFWGMTLVFATFYTAFTSQIHKWAHMDSPPKVVRFLQRSRLILSPEHHAVHHAAPYHRNYCITVGWMNGVLHAVRYFETMERVITALTGAIPREDDVGKETALDILEASDEEAAAATATADKRMAP